MGTPHIIFLTLAFDNLFGVRQILEPLGIQAFGPEGSIERFDEGIVGRLPGREKSIFTPF